MNKYTWRKNFTASISDSDKNIRGKLAFKTKNIQWLDTTSPVIILVSVHSAFHDEIGGDLKMNALVSTIKDHVKGKITVLLSDRAHIQTVSLNYQSNLELAFEDCHCSAQRLSHRYQSYFQDCNVVYWHSYICEDENFTSFLDRLKHAYQTDATFRELVQNDAETTYTSERMQIYADKTLFIEKTVGDILEQSASILVLANKGYRFQFYPGSPYASIEYVNSIFNPTDKKLAWIDVFLSIEKKTVTPLALESNIA